MIMWSSLRIDPKSSLIQSSSLVTTTWPFTCLTFIVTFSWWFLAGSTSLHLALLNRLVFKLFLSQLSHLRSTRQLPQDNSSPFKEPWESIKIECILLSSLSALTRHVKHQHGHLYTCSECKNNFQSKSNLKQHLKTHRLEKKTPMCPLPETV